MRLLIKKDPTITHDELQELMDDFSAFYEEFAGITPQYHVEELSYSKVPTAVDGDGDVKPAYSWRKQVARHVYSRYLEFGVDHIVLLVHEDNWRFKGIWGTNWSNSFWTYHMQLCRFDKGNKANSLGTLYHEVMHSHDALIVTTLGIDITTKLGIKDWDREIVHGKHPDASYIRYKENTDWLRQIAPFLRTAYEKRADLHQHKVGIYRKLAKVLQVLVMRLQKKRKNGVPRYS